MTQLAFGFDPAHCVGCGACVAACMQEHALPTGVQWRHLEKFPPHAGKSDLRFLSWSCLHCQEPACCDACPAHALSKGPDGVVAHLPERCLGCGHCRMACPFGVPQYDSRQGIVTQCDFCADRRADGWEPACVEVCFTQALTWGPLADLETRGFTVRETIGFPPSGLTRPAVRFRPEEDR